MGLVTARVRARRRRVPVEGRVIGVAGGRWRATVDAAGGIWPHDGSPALEWHIAGDDRWYSPTDEVTLRQKWYAGTPVCETRIRVGGGDVISRAYCVADEGGITVVEFENDTPMPVAVALTRGDLLTARDIPSTTPGGMDLPEGSIVLPLGHKSTVRVGLAHASAARGRLPVDLPGAPAVVRGWETACEVASRLVLPDNEIVAAVTRARSQVLLDNGPSGGGAAGSATEAVRLGIGHRDSIVEVVETVQSRLRAERRSRMLAWDTPHALVTAARACAMLDDEIALADIADSWLRVADRPVGPAPDQPPDGVEAIAWAESALAAGSPSGGCCTLFPRGIPREWWGAPLEAHGLVGDAHREVAFAVRWHGARPAVLWEVSGPVGLVLDGGLADPEWHSVETSGEALWAPPADDGG